MIDKVTSSAAVKRVQRQIKPIRLFIEKVVNDWSFNLASMVAYTLVIALIPIAVTLFGISGFILRDHPHIQQNLKNKIINSFSNESTLREGFGQVYIFS